MVDVLASEYGWTVEYALGLPVDVAAMISHAILYRRGSEPTFKRSTKAECTPDLLTKLEGIFGQIDKNQ
jgi:hypothetical protein